MGKSVYLAALAWVAIVKMATDSKYKEMQCTQYTVVSWVIK
jgi:hypothetical protein